MTERDEQALREALQALGPDESVDPEAARHRAAERRRNGRALAGIAVALVLVAGVIGLPRLFPAEQAQPTAAGGAGAESAPRAEAPQADRARVRWRTEYYRDIRFSVPADWGYAIPPSPGSWCAGDGKLRPEQRGSFVWLSAQIIEPAISCGPMPDSLLAEHVAALSPGPAVDYVEGAVKQGDWWVVTRFAGSAVLVVTTKERTLAEQILTSAEVEPEDAPCSPASPVAGPLGARPANATDLTALSPVDEVVLCQYEPVVDRDDAELPRLRATVMLTGSEAQNLVSALAAAPVNNSSCEPALDGAPDLAVVARVRTGDRTADIHIAATGCPDGDSGMAGGIDDGTTLRLLTRDVCRQVLTPPVQLFSGGGDVARNCLG
jgi:hypothetical protein